jgi:hypothetical protein
MPAAARSRQDQRRGRPCRRFSVTRLMCGSAVRWSSGWSQPGSSRPACCMALSARCLLASVLADGPGRSGRRLRNLWFDTCRCRYPSSRGDYRSLRDDAATREPDAINSPSSWTRTWSPCTRSSTDGWLSLAASPVPTPWTPPACFLGLSGPGLTRADRCIQIGPIARRHGFEMTVANAASRRARCTAKQRRSRWRERARPTDRLIQEERPGGMPYSLCYKDRSGVWMPEDCS